MRRVQTKTNRNRTFLKMAAWILTVCLLWAVTSCTATGQETGTETGADSQPSAGTQTAAAEEQTTDTEEQTWEEEPYTGPYVENGFTVLSPVGADVEPSSSYRVAYRVRETVPVSSPWVSASLSFGVLDGRIYEDADSARQYAGIFLGFDGEPLCEVATEDFPAYSVTYHHVVDEDVIYYRPVDREGTNGDALYYLDGYYLFTHEEEIRLPTSVFTEQAGTLTFALVLYDRTGEDIQGDVPGSITLEYVKEGDTVRIISPMAGLEVVPASEAVMEGEGNP